MSKRNDDMNMIFQENALQRYSEVDLLSIDGRMGRKRYFVYSMIIPFLLFWSITSIASVLTHLGSFASQLSYALLAIAVLVVAFIMVRFTIQRCHDFNRSGTLAIFAIIPFANIIFSLIPGNSGINKYGETPEPASAFIHTLTYVLATILVMATLYALSIYLPKML